MNESGINVDYLSLWDFDLDKLKRELTSESRLIRRDARRLVAKKAISSPGDFPGKDSGVLQRTIQVKKFRSGLGFYITHRMPAGTFRYPFVLAYGSEKRGIAPRKDHINEVFKQRRPAIIDGLRRALRNSAKEDRIK